MFSVVVPTMWQCDYIYDMIEKYNKSKFVGEIIVIDNGGTRSRTIKPNKKLRVLRQSKNIYVNPAWNMGASLASYPVILINDDVYIERLDEVLEFTEIASQEHDLIAVDRRGCISDGEIKIKPFDGIFESNRGSFIYLKNYTYIPNQIKIVGGDSIFLDKAKTPALIYGFEVRGERKTTRSKLNTSLVEKNDIKEYYDLKKTSDKNIIIRTCNRPNYFKNCIDSIREYAKDFLLHIVIEDERDLIYVKENCKDLNYNYYLVDKKTITTFASKIPIERLKFVPNYYFNVVKPFLSGFVVHLDDDDILLRVPILPKSKGRIVLSRVDVGWLVPEDGLMGKIPMLKHISNLGISYHSDDMVDFTPQKGGDFFFIREMFGKCKVKWKWDVVAKVQERQNYGNKKDRVVGY